MYNLQKYIYVLICICNKYSNIEKTSFILQKLFSRNLQQFFCLCNFSGRFKHFFTFLQISTSQNRDFKFFGQCYCKINDHINISIIALVTFPVVCFPQKTKNVKKTAKKKFVVSIYSAVRKHILGLLPGVLICGLKVIFLRMRSHKNNNKISREIGPDILPPKLMLR